MLVYRLDLSKTPFSEVSDGFQSHRSGEVIDISAHPDWKKCCKCVRVKNIGKVKPGSIIKVTYATWKGEKVSIGEIKEISEGRVYILHNTDLVKAEIPIRKIINFIVYKEE